MQSDIDVKLALRHAPPFALCEENLSGHDFPCFTKCTVASIANRRFGS